MHPSGALYWPSQFSLLVADLHFEKGSSYHKTGQFLPPYDTHQTLEKLETVIKYFKPRRIFFLGDTFHDMSAWKRMPDVNKSRLLNAVENLEAVWIEGNHDQGGVPDRFKSLEKIEVDGPPQKDSMSVSCDHSQFVMDVIDIANIAGRKGFGDFIWLGWDASHWTGGEQEKKTWKIRRRKVRKMAKRKEKVTKRKRKKKIRKEKEKEKPLVQVEAELEVME